MAEPYRKDMDFAFFVVNFGYSKKDYEALTPREICFIKKEWERKKVDDSTLERNTMLNAVINSLRKKNSPIKALWRKIARPADKEKAKEDLKTVMEIEKSEGKSWVEAIFAANGRKKRKEV